MKNNVLLISLLIFISLNLLAQQNEENGFNDQSTQSNIYFTQTDVRTLTDRNLNNVISLYSGVDFIRNNLYIRGSFPEANVYMIDGIPFNSYDKDAAFHLPFQTWENISLTKGSSNAQFGFGENFINQNIKTASDKLVFNVEYLTDNISFKSKGDAFDGQKRLGSHWFGYSNFNASLSAPIYNDQIKFFGNISYRFERDKNPQNYPGIEIGKVNDLTSGDSISLQYPAGSLLNNSLQNINYTGKLFFDFKPVQFTFSGHYSDQTQYDPFQSGIITNFLNPFRTEEESIQKWFINAGFNHEVSDKISYSINGSYSSFQEKEYDPILKDNFLGYGDSLANANAGLFEDYDAVKWPYRHTNPYYSNVFGFIFSPPGRVVADYNKLFNERFYIKGELDIKLFTNNLLKIGFESSTNKLRKFSIDNDTALRLAGIISFNNSLPPSDPNRRSEKSLLESFGVSNFGFDVFGNEIEVGKENKFIEPIQPTILSFYVSDQYSIDNFNFNLGGRLDKFNFDQWMMTDPENPEKSIQYRTGELIDDGWKKTNSNLFFSPRFSAEYSYDKIYSASFTGGMYYYSPNLFNNYDGLHSVQYNMRSGSTRTTQIFINEIKPVKSINFELAFSIALSKIGLFSLSGFLKDLSNLPLVDIQMVRADSRINNYYAYFQDGALKLKGIEIEFQSISLNGFTFQSWITAQGESTSSSSSNFRSDLPIMPAPIAKNIGFKANTLLSYTYNDNSELILNNLGISTRFTYNNGRLFSRGIAPVVHTGGDRMPISYLADVYLPDYFQVDLSIQKSFFVSNLLKINIYFDVINLFDAENILEVFLNSGKVDDDGLISDPIFIDQYTNTYGEIYPELHRSIRIDYKNNILDSYNQQYGTEVFYGPPRQIRFGIKLEY